MPKAFFDAEGFYNALDSQRQSLKLNWKQVAAQTGVSASTLTRIAQGKRPDVDSLAALIRWSGLKSDDYMHDEEVIRSNAAPLAMITTYLRSDPHLTKEGAIALDELIRVTYERLRTDKD